jgi:hypothetical protein
MSAGSPHHRPNLRHPAELAKLLRTGGAPELAKRWQRLDVDHDITDLAGYDVWGTTRFLDQDFFRALTDPAYAEQIFGAAIDTGLTEAQTVDCLLTHEGDEKVLLDADNEVNLYDAAHEYASSGEDEKVRSYGGTPLRYNRGLARAIAWCEKKIIRKADPNFSCAPLLDDPDKLDNAAIKMLKGLGCVDAFKLGKKSVAYDKSTTSAQCSRCARWQGPRNVDLALCQIVEALVRKDRVCQRFAPMEGSGVQKETGKGPQGVSQAGDPSAPQTGGSPS